jgi:exonuclease I
VNAGNGSGPDGEWTTTDTIRLLCEEVKEATRRADTLLQVEKETCQVGSTDTEADVDITMAKQWRAFRDGYVSWYLDCQRYKLDFLRPDTFYGDDEDLEMACASSN